MSKSQPLNVDINYTKIIASVGIGGAIILSIKNNYGFGKTAILALIFGLAGAYAGKIADQEFGTFN